MREPMQRFEETFEFGNGWSVMDEAVAVVWWVRR
jgi:hypothetical protein